MKKVWMLIFILAISFKAYADETPAVNQGAAELDWQSCVNSKADECVNDCVTSEDISCSDNCKELAKDKCQSMGVTPPE